MTQAGYYRQPTLFQERIVFVCEDDLWSVSTEGGVARRLTNNPGRASYPAFSPDGALLAYAGRDEGTDDVYVMSSLGGEARRLTYLGARTGVTGWTPEGRVVYYSDAAQPFGNMTGLYAVSPAGGEPEVLATGPAVSLSYGPHGARVMRAQHHGYSALEALPGWHDWRAVDRNGKR